MKPGTRPWRTSADSPRIILDADGGLVGMMLRAEDAATICEAVNGPPAPKERTLMVGETPPADDSIEAVAARIDAELARREATRRERP